MENCNGFVAVGGRAVPRLWQDGQCWAIEGTPEEMWRRTVIFEYHMQEESF